MKNNEQIQKYEIWFNNLFLEEEEGDKNEQKGIFGSWKCFSATQLDSLSW